MMSFFSRGGKDKEKLGGKKGNTTSSMIKEFSANTTFQNPFGDKHNSNVDLGLSKNNKDVADKQENKLLFAMKHAAVKLPKSVQVNVLNQAEIITPTTNQIKPGQFIDLIKNGIKNYKSKPEYTKHVKDKSYKKGKEIIDKIIKLTKISGSPRTGQDFEIFNDHHNAKNGSAVISYANEQLNNKENQTVLFDYPSLRNLLEQIDNQIPFDSVKKYPEKNAVGPRGKNEEKQNTARTYQYISKGDKKKGVGETVPKEKEEVDINDLKKTFKN